jgi:DNA polymerase I-like protein with 3'-5' exonuclease and polymerase domains
LGVTRFEATDLMQLHRDRYRDYWRWSERTLDRADLTCRIGTNLGWSMRITDKTTQNSLMNWPMQAHGAELMRLAAIALTEAGVRVNAPVHDAFLIEAPTDKIECIARLSRKIMRQAGVSLLGTPLATDATIYKAPARYMDSKQGASEMWRKVNMWLNDVEGRSGHIR